jgi:uncharacterized membrane-anchored protein YhcB (DUF1043 family)
MTRSSLSATGAAPRNDIERIAEDLRRQRDHFERQRQAFETSFGTTASLLRKIEELRLRSEALAGNASKDGS